MKISQRCFSCTPSCVRTFVTSVLVLLEFKDKRNFDLYKHFNDLNTNLVSTRHLEISKKTFGRDEFES